MLKKPELFPDGYFLTAIDLPSSLKQQVQEENWKCLDDEIRNLTTPGGRFFQFLQDFHDFESIETMISIRDSQNEWEEDGIWHDDGSRLFSFSLSLTEKPIRGGKLGIRKKGEHAFHEIPTPPYGTMILFLTGAYGFEHKIHQVISGKRIIVVGWCK